MDRTIRLEDLLQNLQAARDTEDLSDTLATTARLMGFDYFAFGLRMPYPLVSPKTGTVNNYPSRWQALYADSNYLAVDPTVQHGLRSSLPLTWSDKLFSSATPLWEDARSFGLNHGWAQACRDARGNVGMLTLARSSQSISDKELLAKSAQLSWLAQMALAGFSKFMIPELDSPDRLSLTAREIEILRWTAEGKTSQAISAILGISQRTVNFHINKVLPKLQSANKTAAVVQAALMGLI